MSEVHHRRAHNEGEAAWDDIKSAGRHGKKAFHDAEDDAKENINSNIEHGKKNVREGKNQVKGAINATVQEGEEVADDMKDKAKSTWNQMKDAVHGLTDKVKGVLALDDDDDYVDEDTPRDVKSKPKERDVSHSSNIEHGKKPVVHHEANDSHHSNNMDHPTSKSLMTPTRTIIPPRWKTPRESIMKTFSNPRMTISTMPTLSMERNRSLMMFTMLSTNRNNNMERTLPMKLMV